MLLEAEARAAQPGAADAEFAADPDLTDLATDLSDLAADPADSTDPADPADLSDLAADLADLTDLAADLTDLSDLTDLANLSDLSDLAASTGGLGWPTVGSNVASHGTCRGRRKLEKAESSAGNLGKEAIADGKRLRARIGGLAQQTRLATDLADLTADLADLTDLTTDLAADLADLTA